MHTARDFTQVERNFYILWADMKLPSKIKKSA